MKFIICSLNKNEINSFKQIFHNYPDFSVLHKNILHETNADCIVSPGNSYGLMDGGVDRTISYALTDISMNKVQPYIKKYFGGEQPVGVSFIVPTESTHYKYLAHCPTVRTPKNISNTDNAYLAFRGLLCCIDNHNRKYNDIETVLMTPFCTGAGMMKLSKAAKQMKLAYDMHNKNNCSWSWAISINNQLENM